MDRRVKRAVAASAATVIMLPWLTGTAWAQDTAPADTHDHTYDTGYSGEYHWDYHEIAYHVHDPDASPPPTEPVVCDSTDVFDPYSGQCVEPETEEVEEPGEAPPPSDHSHDPAPPAPVTAEPSQTPVHYHDHVQDWIYVVLHSHEDSAPGTTDSAYQPHGTYVAYEGATAPAESYHCGFPTWWFEFH